MKFESLDEREFFFIPFTHYKLGKMLLLEKIISPER